MNFKVRVLLIGILILSSGYFLYRLATFEIFEVELKEIATLQVQNRSYKIGLFYLPSNASSQSYIQIRNLNTDSVLQSYIRFNFVNEYRINKDILRLVLSDTSFAFQKPDTVYLKLP
jgi:hypothetical protein